MQDKQAIRNYFSPDDYKFTHLYSDQQSIHLDDAKLDHALYLLKYALRATLDQLLSRSTQYFTYTDEISTASISKQIKDYVDINDQKKVDDHIGFAVLIEFDPVDNQGKTAALTLLNIGEKVNKHKGNLH